MAVQYGLDTFAEDVAAVKRTLGRVSSPAILVGHSYGGATITAAGTADRVIGLVYIAAVAPGAGETVQGQLNNYPTDVFKNIAVADGRVWLVPPEGTKCFAGDLPEQEQKVAWATHYAPAADLFEQQKLKLNDIAWKSKPSWYIVAKADRTVHPDLHEARTPRCLSLASHELQTNGISIGPSDGSSLDLERALLKTDCPRSMPGGITRSSCRLDRGSSISALRFQVSPALDPRARPCFADRYGQCRYRRPAG
jgi:pimeloyl-ACP methyl ester carboxylesterase